LDRKKNGEYLQDIEVHDIMCHIANAVLAGGIRRAAMIALFSHDSTAMLECKYGAWWELNEQRGRANNSAILKRGNITEQDFLDLWKKIELSGSGEPGFYWTNDTDWGTNPCCEVALKPFQFCNLCEINVDNIQDQQDLEERSSVAAFFGTLQASFTDFHYLRPVWQRTTEKDALIGIGMTGIASGKILELDLTKAAEIVKSKNNTVAKLIGINSAARTTLVKPSGTTSLVVGSSSGIHAWHDQHFLRTIRFSVNEDIAQYMLVNHPELCEQDQLRHDVVCVRIPMEAPENAILRSESAIDLLERVKKFSEEWIKPGHIDGVNTHNVSATISIDKSRKYGNTDITINEWEVVGNWMWDNRNSYNGLSVMPYDGGSYIQAPFETCTKEEYERREKLLTSIDLTKVNELDDNTTLTESNACAGGKCEIS
jgi:ribonucleoside-diphosphate reductase alpha chain